MDSASSFCDASPGTAVASKPRDRRNSAVSSATSGTMSFAAILAPSLAMRCAIVPPLLGLAPKTRATFPSSLPKALFHLEDGGDPGAVQNRAGVQIAVAHF